MSFVDSRTQLHWAAQAVAGVGRSLLAPKPDDSHSNLEWLRMNRALAGSAFDDGTRAGIRFRDFTLLVIKDRGLIDEEFALRGKTIEDAFGFFEAYFGKALRRPSEAEALPAPPPATFDANADDLARLDRLYDDADCVLRAYASKRANASDVRCWPHHFDIATLETCGDGKSLGAGFVPGDDHYAEPYWYVTPYPYPDDRHGYPSPPIGMCHLEPWFGAVHRGDVSREEAMEFLETASAHFAPIVSPRA